MLVFLALSADSAARVKELGYVPFDIFESKWPQHYAKKWIPLAPSREEAIRSFKAAGTYTGNGCELLQVAFPDETWFALTSTNCVVPNPGWKRCGSDHTDRRGHWLWCRVPLAHQNPYFPHAAFDDAWESVEVS